jgi:hypothetical protein
MGRKRSKKEKVVSMKTVIAMSNANERIKLKEVT